MTALRLQFAVRLFKFKIFYFNFSKGTYSNSPDLFFSIGLLTPDKFS
jgi:hypothetical protein